MTRRTPLAKAEATGRTLHDPARFKSRREPLVSQPLGLPPKWMKDKNALEAWREITGEVPWLNKSHRAIVEIIAGIRGQLMAGDEISIAGYNLLRLCLGQIGATPADSSKVTMADDETPEDDVSKKYFS